MKIFILTLALLPAALSTDKCDACIFGICHYMKQIYKACDCIFLKKVLAVDYTEKIIYCEFQQFRQSGTFIGGYSGNNTFEVLGYTNEIDSCTVDQNSHDVYIVSQKGNLKYHPYKGWMPNAGDVSSTEELPVLTSTDYLYRFKTIGRLHYQDTLYVSYTNYVGLYTLGNDSLSTVSGDSYFKEFVVDKYHDVYFKSMNDKFYILKNKTKTVEYLSDEKFTLSVDRYGDAYLNKDKKLYKIINQQPVEVGYFNLNKDFKPVFDWKNNILFVYLNELYVLKPRRGKSRWCTYQYGEITTICKNKTDHVHCGRSDKGGDLKRV